MVQTYLSSDGECCYAGSGSGFDISTISLEHNSLLIHIVQVLEVLMIILLEIMLVEGVGFL